MSRFKRKAFLLEVSPSHIRLLEDGPLDQLTAVLSMEVPPHPEQPDWLALLPEALQDVGLVGRNLSVVVDDRLARIFMVQPPAQLTRLSDLRRVTTMRFSNLYGVEAKDWVIEADWHNQRPFMACALPTALTHALQTACASHRVNLLVVAPGLVDVWNRCAAQIPQQDSWLVVERDGHVSIAIAQQQHVVAVRTGLPPLPHAMDDMRLQLRRVALLQGLPEPINIHVHGDGLDKWHGISIDGQQFKSLTMSRSAAS